MGSPTHLSLLACLPASSSDENKRCGASGKLARSDGPDRALGAAEHPARDDDNMKAAQIIWRGSCSCNAIIKKHIAQMSDELFSLSSIDGRYARETEPL